MTKSLEVQAKELEKKVNDEIQRECATSSPFLWNEIRDRILLDWNVADHWDWIDVQQIGGFPEIALTQHHTKSTNPTED